jgi:hypothetical protein
VAGSRDIPLLVLPQLAGCIREGFTHCHVSVGVGRLIDRIPRHDDVVVGKLELNANPVVVSLAVLARHALDRDLAARDLATMTIKGLQSVAGGAHEGIRRTELMKPDLQRHHATPFLTLSRCRGADRARKIAPWWTGPFCPA